MKNIEHSEESSLRSGAVPNQSSQGVGSLGTVILSEKTQSTTLFCWVVGPPFSTKRGDLPTLWVSSLQPGPQQVLPLPERTDDKRFVWHQHFPKPNLSGRTNFGQEKRNPQSFSRKCKQSIWLFCVVTVQLVVNGFTEYARG